jgi:hypothetical protein
MSQSQSNGKPAKFHRFEVHYRSRTQKIGGVKKYTSVDDIKRDAFNLFKPTELSDSNAILTWSNSGQNRILLSTVPDLLVEGQYRNLFIESVSTFFSHSNRDNVEPVFRPVLSVPLASVLSAFSNIIVCSSAQRRNVVNSIAVNVSD